MITTSGASSPDEAKGDVAVLGLACDPEALIREEVLEARAKEIVVVDEQHAQVVELLPCGAARRGDSAHGSLAWSFTTSARV